MPASVTQLPDDGDQLQRLPRSLFGYIWRQGARHQIALCLLAVAVFLLSAVPLEIQRRLVDDAIAHGTERTIVLLAGAYFAVALAEGGLKLIMNIYRGWISENTVRHLRRLISGEIQHDARALHTSDAEGVEISIILSEADPVGGFVGLSLSEPLLQGGVLASIFGYMVYLQPHMALLCLLVFSPQLVFVPLMQHAINRLAGLRIQTLRDVSGGIAAVNTKDRQLAILQDGRIDRVFEFNMGIYKLKFSMNFLMNAMYHLGITITLAVGGWYAVKGRIEVGTVVAFLSGLTKVNDPWGDIVNWFREMATCRVKYRLIVQASDWLLKLRDSSTNAAA
jgi:ABC-type multidrug transport system fused ATPase/permease subunit